MAKSPWRKLFPPIINFPLFFFFCPHGQSDSLWYSIWRRVGHVNFLKNTSLRSVGWWSYQSCDRRTSGFRTFKWAFTNNRWYYEGSLYKIRFRFSCREHTKNVLWALDNQFYRRVLDAFKLGKVNRIHNYVQNGQGFELNLSLLNRIVTYLTPESRIKMNNYARRSKEVSDSWPNHKNYKIAELQKQYHKWFQETFGDQIFRPSLRSDRAPNLPPNLPALAWSNFTAMSQWLKRKEEAMHNSAHNYTDQAASDGAFWDATGFATDKAAEAHFRAGRLFDFWGRSYITPGETYRTARDAVCELIYRNRYQDAFEIAYQNSFMLRYQEAYKWAYEKGHTSTCRTPSRPPSTSYS